MSEMTRWLSDVLWAWRMFRAKRYRRGLTFSRRMSFESELWTATDSGERIAYPSAFFHLKRHDFARAFEAVGGHRPSPRITVITDTEN